MVLKSREKILIVLIMIAIAFWAFDRFYYTAQSRQISKLKEEVKAADLKLDQSPLITKGVKTVEAEVVQLERKLKELSERTLRGEEFRAFLRHLAKESDSLQMKIISLTPEEEKLPLPEGKKGVPVQYKRITIQMILHATYPKLVTYLKDIQGLPFLVHVESLQIEKKEEVLPFLRVTLWLTMNVISL